MLKSCSYCGSIHDRQHQCSSKPKREKKLTHVDKFRWTRAWQNKRKQIREDRDKHMCQVCIRELYDTRIKYNFTNIQVHHIIPVAEDYSKRLNDSCLISVCPHHHSMAERGEISREELFEIVKEQEEKNNF